MRKTLLGLVLALAAVAAPAVQALTVNPALPKSGGDLCQPDPTIQVEQTLHCRYGPLTVTPGTNLILLGPETIESPRANGFVTSISPNLVDSVSGEVPPIHVVHLHHGVWINAAQGNTTPFFATGEEKTRSILPEGYGYRTRPTDAWVLNYMLHNLTANTYTVTIRYDLTWVPATTPEVKEVVPVWFDAVAQNEGSGKALYPVYDPERDGSGYSAEFTAGQDAELVWVGGHVHPGGLRDELRSVTCPRPLFTSEARMNGAESFGSWDYGMTVTPTDWRYKVHKGEKLSVTGFYDNANPWYEAMAIMFAWAHPLPAGEAPADCDQKQAPLSTVGATTDAPYAPENNPPPVFGGGQETQIAPSSNPPPLAQDVGIAGFGYYPGGGSGAPAGVQRGGTVRFTNLDAAASIFHSVTSCVNPCNGLWGQKYPLATWPSSGNLGDSGQLGYGPPAATAAVQRATWSFTVPDDALLGQIYTYFCRIHPQMRGSLEVVS